MSTKPTLTIDSQDLRDGLLLALDGLIDREEKRQAGCLHGEPVLSLIASERLVREARQAETQLTAGCSTVSIGDLGPALGRRAHAMGRALAAVEAALAGDA